MDMVTSAHDSDVVPAGRVSPVNSHNEWDPLEEVIVGRLEGAVIPSDHPVVTCNIPGRAARAQSLFAGFRYPRIMIEPAQRELDGFVALLQSLGIAVIDRNRSITRNGSARRNGLRMGSAIPALATACL
jgi:glycine amidinotransferase